MAACTVLAPPVAARAQASSVYLDWQQPRAAGCPPQALIEHDVEQVLGRSVFATAPRASLIVRGRVDERPGALIVQLEARNSDGTWLGMRELRGRPGECDALRDAIGLVLTLFCEREGLLSKPLRSESGTAWQLHGGLGAALMAEIWPRALVGIGPALALRRSDGVELRADAGYWLPMALRAPRDIYAELHGVSVAARLCPRLAGNQRSAFQLWLCGGAQLGLWIVLQTQPVTQTQLRSLAQALLELRGTLRFGPGLEAQLALGPIADLTRTSLYSVRSDGTRELLYRVPPLGLLASLNLVL
jgi:hypothetical protein